MCLGSSLEALRACVETVSGTAWAENCVVFSSGSASTLAQTMAGGGEGVGLDFFILGAGLVEGGGGRVCVAFSSGITPHSMLLGWLWAVCLLRGRETTSCELERVLVEWKAQGWDTENVSALEEAGYRVSLMNKKSL